MSDCQFCSLEQDCGYEYKPTDCAQQRKFKPIDHYKKQDEIQASIKTISGVIDSAKTKDPEFHAELKILLRNPQ